MHLERLDSAGPSKIWFEARRCVPLIISYTACDENLSIQVHPTDEYARSHENMPYGNKRSLVLPNAPTAGWIYAEQLTRTNRQLTKQPSKISMKKS